MNVSPRLVIKDAAYWADYRARNRTAIRKRHSAYMKRYRASERARDAAAIRFAKSFYCTI